MIRFIPFLLASGGVHAALCFLCGSLLLCTTGPVGSKHGLEPRLYVTIVAQEEARAQAESPARQDSTASQPVQPQQEKTEHEPAEAPKKILEREEANESQQPAPCPDALVESAEEDGSDAPILAREIDKPTPLVDRSGKTSQEDDEGETPEATEGAVQDHGSKKEKEKEEAEDRPPQESSISSLAQAASRESRFRASRGKDLANFRDSLLAAIRHASYFPTEALRKRKLGETTMRFTVGRNGSVSGLAVVHSSGSRLLDETAIKIVENAAKNFPPIPGSISKDSLNYVVPIVFKKRESRKK